jgi:hypothetical protein
VRLQPGANTVGHLLATAMGLVMRRHRTVPLTECRVAGDKTQHATPLKTSFATPSRCALQCITKPVRYLTRQEGGSS